MALTVVVGGQYGSEGKGKLVSNLVCSDPGPVAVVRCGGSNAGHTAEAGGRRLILRQLPSGAIDRGCLLFLAAGMQIDLGVLLSEIEALGVGPEQLTIDANATLIEPGDAVTEGDHGLLERVGSTLTGTGAAIARRVMRGPDVRRATDAPALAPYIGDVSRRLAGLLDEGVNLIVEGTQGAGLSLHHGPFPYVTGRDTTAAAFLSEAGIPPMHVDEVVVVLRTFPIRVAGASGPMYRETTWDDVQARSGYPTALAEHTTVTGRLRRVGDFDWDLAARAVRLNGPTALAIHGIDYLDYGALGCRRWERLGQVARSFVDELEIRLGVPVRWLYTGPTARDLIDRGVRPALSPLARRPEHRVGARRQPIPPTRT